MEADKILHNTLILLQAIEPVTAVPSTLVRIRHKIQEIKTYLEEFAPELLERHEEKVALNEGYGWVGSQYVKLEAGVTPAQLIRRGVRDDF